MRNIATGSNCARITGLPTALFEGVSCVESSSAGAINKTQRLAGLQGKTIR